VSIFNLLLIFTHITGYNSAYILFLNILVCNCFLLTIIISVSFLNKKIYILIMDIYILIMRDNYVSIKWGNIFSREQIYMMNLIYHNNCEIV